MNVDLSDVKELISRENVKDDPYYKSLRKLIKKHPDMFSSYEEMSKTFSSYGYCIEIHIDNDSHKFTVNSANVGEKIIDVVKNILQALDWGSLPVTEYQLKYPQFTEEKLEAMRQAMFLDSSGETAQPLFVVEEADYVPCNEDYHKVDVVKYHCPEAEDTYDSKEDLLNAMHELEIRNPKEGDDYYEVPCTKQWKVVNFFFTKHSATEWKEERSGRELRVYAWSMHDKHELKLVRNFILLGGKMNVSEEECKLIREKYAPKMKEM